MRYWIELDLSKIVHNRNVLHINSLRFICPSVEVSLAFLNTVHFSYM